LSDDRLCWAVIERFWPDVNCDQQARIAAGTPGQRAIYALTVFAREVDNGGLEQFFWNSSGDLYPQVLAGLARVGADDRTAILRTAASFFDDEQTVHRRSLRQAKLSAASRDEKEAFFGPLTHQLYGQKRGVELELMPLFVRYINNHPDEFSADPASS
jgi:hypothetical protein